MNWNCIGIPDDELSLLSPFVQKIKQALSSLGLFIENGVARAREVFAEKVVTEEITAETARIKK